MNPRPKAWFLSINGWICVNVSRYIFLFDKVVIVCKRKGYNYELKEIIELQSYKMSDDLMNNRDMKKVKKTLSFVWRNDEGDLAQKVFVNVASPV